MDGCITQRARVGLLSTLLPPPCFLSVCLSLSYWPLGFPRLQLIGDSSEKSPHILHVVASSPAKTQTVRLCNAPRWRFRALPTSTRPDCKKTQTMGVLSLFITLKGLDFCFPSIHRISRTSPYSLTGFFLVAVQRSAWLHLQDSSPSCDKTKQRLRLKHISLYL